MSDASEIGRAGERFIVEGLRNEGFRVEWDTRLPGSADIDAANSNRHLLIQVKSAVYPNEPADTSQQEETNLKSRAARIGAEAWEARVQLNTDLQGRSRKWRQLV